MKQKTYDLLEWAVETSADYITISQEEVKEIIDELKKFNEIKVLLKTFK